MHFRFLLSDQNGDIELSEAELKQPFLVSPSEEHPFLTLADYFGALEKFILDDEGNLLQSALKKQITLPEISEVIFRSEKHGAFYHIASIELLSPEKNIKLAVTTALSEAARISLDEEYSILRQLVEMTPDYIPQTYCKKSVSIATGAGSEEFLMVLGEWLEGYHEWHIGDDPDTGSRRIHLWDYVNGYRFLTDEESYEVLRQSALILTYYYNQESFSQIYPWHHGAGDFIIAAAPGTISVKLITARDYEPLVHFEQPNETDQMVAAIHFLLNLVLRMRLDRLDGVFEPVWLGPFAAEAAVAGFFVGLAKTQDKDRLIIGPVTEFLEIMQSFDVQEIYDMYDSLLEIYAEEDQDDFNLIKDKLSEHAAEVHQILQGFSL
jgi:hypothetical protein